MAVRNATVEVAKCDACGKTTIVGDAGDYPNGYYGEVREVAESGGSAEVSWYACRPAHIRTAVLSALATDDTFGQWADA
jgi:hypothetical protein